MSCGKKPGFPTTETNFKEKRRMECGWVKVKNPLENPGNLAEDPLKIPGKIFHFVASLVNRERVARRHFSSICFFEEIVSRIVCSAFLSSMYHDIFESYNVRQIGKFA